MAIGDNLFRQVKRDSVPYANEIDRQLELEDEVKLRVKRKMAEG